MNEETQKKILNNSIDLVEYGINSFAWSKNNAILMLYSILHDNIGIWGGDVFEISDILIPTYDNWYCEPFANETKQEFFLRSKLYTIDYIKKYNIKINQNVVFLIEFTEYLK